MNPPTPLRCALTLKDEGVIAGWAPDPGFCGAAGWTFGAPYADVLLFHQKACPFSTPDLIRLVAVRDEVPVGYVDLSGLEPRRRELGFFIG
jgi:hypothetical protein